MQRGYKRSVCVLPLTDIPPTRACFCKLQSKRFHSPGDAVKDALLSCQARDLVVLKEGMFDHCANPRLLIVKNP